MPDERRWTIRRGPRSNNVRGPNTEGEVVVPLAEADRLRAERDRYREALREASAALADASIVLDGDGRAVASLEAARASDKAAALEGSEDE